MGNLSDILEIASLTDTGQKRGHNEDSIGSQASLGLVVLADGMGGYKAGEIASAMAVNTVIEGFKKRLKKLPQADEEDEAEYTPESLLMQQIVEETNSVIFEASTSNPQYNGMGTTIVSVLFYNNQMTIAHVGDSRLYRLRGDALEVITSDHTVLRELVERGFYTEDEARASTNKNLVTRALGIEPSVQVDIQEDLALPGDIYLLCSDGLNDMVTDEDICLTLQKYSDNLDDAVNALVQQANENGGHDNISAILVRPLKPFPAKNGLLDRVVDWFF